MHFKTKQAGAILNEVVMHFESKQARPMHFGKEVGRCMFKGSRLMPMDHAEEGYKKIGGLNTLTIRFFPQMSPTSRFCH